MYIRDRHFGGTVLYSPPQIARIMQQKGILDEAFVDKWCKIRLQLVDQMLTTNAKQDFVKLYNHDQGMELLIRQGLRNVPNCQKELGHLREYRLSCAIMVVYAYLENLQEREAYEATKHFQENDPLSFDVCVVLLCAPNRLEMAITLAKLFRLAWNEHKRIRVNCRIIHEVLADPESADESDPIPTPEEDQEPTYLGRF